MKKPKVYAHASYIGNTGYNNHTRDFFRQLSKYIDLKVRNFTIGKEWNWPSDEPHNDENYINEVDKKLLIEQTLWINREKGERSDFPIYKNYPNEFEHNVNLVLEETDHNFFYDKYIGPKIAYNVWESTLQPEHFFNKLKEYDQIWVPSQWQAECTIAQGMPSDKVKVVPEGVDVNTFYPEDPKTVLDYVDGRFKFVVFGRWDYRKSTKELIETFLKEFKPEEPVDLIVSIAMGFNSFMRVVRTFTESNSEVVVEGAELVGKTIGTVRKNSSKLMGMIDNLKQGIPNGDEISRPIQEGGENIRFALPVDGEREVDNIGGYRKSNSNNKFTRSRKRIENSFRRFKNLNNSVNYKQYHQTYRTRKHITL